MEVDLDSSEDKTLIMNKSSDSLSNSTCEQNENKTLDEIESDDNEQIKSDDNEQLKSDDTEEKEDEWLDILGSGQLLKKVVKQGKSDSRPQRLDLCTVRYTGKLNDEVVDEGTVTINIGDAEVIQGLDLAVPLMDVEEEAEVIVGPRFAFGSEGRKPDIPPDATLHYTVALLNAEPEPLLETLTLETRKEVGNRKKERGNYWYSRKDHTLAIQCYRRALEYLDDIGLTSSGDNKAICEEAVHSLLEDRIKVYNNLAAAQMKIKAFDTALQSIDNVLRCQPNNVKALFRKGKILAEKGETEEGITLLRKTLTLDPDNVQAKNELTQLLAKQKKDTAQQRKLYKKMLGGTNKPVEDRSLSPARELQTRRWGMVVGCVGAIFSMFIAYKWYKPV